MKSGISSIWSQWSRAQDQAGIEEMDDESFCTSCQFLIFSFSLAKNPLGNEACHCNALGNQANRNCCANLNGRLMTPTKQTLINEHLSLTCSATLQPGKRNSSQDSGGVDRRARSSGHYRGGGAIKPRLPSLSLPQGPLALPIKLWESHGCNEVPGNQSGHYSPIKLPSATKWKHKPKTPAWLQVFTNTSGA